MNCLPCFRKKGPGEKKLDEKKSDDVKEDEELPVAQPKENPVDKQSSVKNSDIKKHNEDDNGDVNKQGDDIAIDELPKGLARRFKYQDLALATNSFEAENLLGESGIGQVYKGILADGKVVAVKQLDKIKTKANNEFVEEVVKLSNLHHPNLMQLVGYCADDDNRILVYSYMQMGSINDHLHDLPEGKKPLDWIIRMKVAEGVAQALEYLHEKVDPPVHCGNIRSTNVLLDENFKPKVADYWLVNLESTSSGSNVHKMVVGTVGCAPESEYTGELTLKSHVYSFGVILLELITGRKALDDSRPIGEQNLVYWAQPYFNNPKKIYKLTDPLFNGVVPEKVLNQVADVAAMCLQDEWSARPSISDITGTLNFLTVPSLEGFTSPPTSVSNPPKQYVSSSSSSSSDSDSDQELCIKIEPFNRPEPEPRIEQDTQIETDTEPEPEPEPEWESELETEVEPQPDFTYSDSDSDLDSTPELISNFEQVIEPLSKSESKPDFTHSNSGSESDLDPKAISEPESVLEPASKPVPDVPNSVLDLEPISKNEPLLEPMSNPEPVLEPKPFPEPVSNPEPVQVSNSETIPEPVSKPELVLEPARFSSHKHEPSLHHDSDGSSGTIYDEDSYSEEDFSDEEKVDKSILVNSKSKARLKAKSTKKKVMFKPEEKDSINPSMKHINSSYSKKSFNKFKDDDDRSSSNSNNQKEKTKKERKSNSRNDDHRDIEFTDVSDDDFEPQRFKSTISRFSEESRSYREYQDQSDRGSSSEGER